MTDQFDVSLEDDDLLDEVELTANLMVAANQSDRHLSAEEIDAVLGVPDGKRPPSFPRPRTGSDRPDLVRR